MSNSFIDGSRQNGRLFNPSPLLSYSQYIGKNTSQCTSTSVSMNAARGMFPKTQVRVLFMQLSDRQQSVFGHRSLCRKKPIIGIIFGGFEFIILYFHKPPKHFFYFIIFFHSSLQVEIWKGYGSVFLHRLQDRKLSTLSILPITTNDHDCFFIFFGPVYRQKDNIANGLLISVFER